MAFGRMGAKAPPDIPRVDGMFFLGGFFFFFVFSSRCSGIDEKNSCQRHIYVDVNE